MNICVFGAARDEIGEDFMALGTALGRELAAERRAEGHEVLADLIARRAEYTDIQYPISSSFFR